MESNRHVGVIGLGLMGTAITERLLGSGFQVFIWNRSPEKAKSLLQRGAVWSDNPLANCRRIIISLYSSDIVAQVLDRFAAALRPGQTIIDTTTGEPEDAVKISARLAQNGVNYLDAPISGSSEQTRRGEATVMVGGDLTVFDACADLWPVLGGKVFHLGLTGSAGKVKLVTNLVLGLNRVALAEGLSYASAMGIRPDVALEVLQASAAYSKTMDTKGTKMIERDFHVQARLSQHFKDVRLILDSAARAGMRLPISEAHAQLLAEAESSGFGDLDNSAIINVYRKPAS